MYNKLLITGSTGFVGRNLISYLSNKYSICEYSFKGKIPSNNIDVLIEALNYFYDKTKNDITLEYILLKDVNDTLEDAADLVKVYRKVPTHLINVIEYNPIEDALFTKPDEDATQQFTDYLVKHKVNVRVRRSRGKDIDAACGQLANK